MIRSLPQRPGRERKQQRLSVLIAAAISIVTGIFCISLGMAGSSILLEKLKINETDRDQLQSDYLSKKIAEAAYLHNWAFIESTIKPILTSEPKISYFYVADSQSRIQIANNDLFLDKKLGETIEAYTEIESIKAHTFNILEVSDVHADVDTSEVYFKSPILSLDNQTLISKGSHILQFRYTVKQEAGAICTIVFGYNIDPLMQSLNYARLIILFCSILTAALLGFITLLITNKILRPLELISETLGKFSGASGSADEKLKQFDLSNIKANSREVQNLISAFELSRDVLRRNIAEMAELRTSAAVANLSQMLAHDLRKPFSLFNIGINMLGRAKDPESVQKTLAKFIPEVDRATKNVNSLLNDLLEIGTKPNQLVRSTTKVTSMLELATYDAFNIYPKADITVEYKLLHTSSVSVDDVRIQRVFGNILHNAIQAMRQKGRIWIHTRDKDNSSLIEFTIGNSGSYISDENRGRLFDMFFTHNKNGGTGLGLAIAKSIVNAQGGTIECHASEGATLAKSTVEFRFTLPSADQPEKVDTKGLPTHSSEFFKNTFAVLAQTPTLTDPRGSQDSSEQLLEAELLKTIESLGRNLSLAIVDDEAIYQNYLLSSIQRSDVLARVITIHLISTPEDTMSRFKTRTFDLIISDIDFGTNDTNGFQLVSEIRALKNISQPLICMHSNRISNTDHRKSVEHGADSFLPKPMAMAHLWKLLLQAAVFAKGQKEPHANA